MGMSLIMLTVLTCFFLFPIGVRVEQGLAEQQPSQGSALPGVSVKAKKMSSSKVNKSVQPFNTDRKRGILPQTAQDARSRKSYPTIKAKSKKIMPKAVAQPRTDLIHYGILEDFQRYDPRPHADSSSVPSPQTPDLTHDHFQELDRNQDGIIDPVERAFGRIDMDRDLHNRTR